MKRRTHSLPDLMAIAPALLLVACHPSVPATAAAVPATPRSAAATPGAAVAPKPGDLLKRAHFGDGHSLPWMPLYIEPARGEMTVDAKRGAMCLKVAAAGKNPWDVQ